MSWKVFVNRLDYGMQTNILIGQQNGDQWSVMEKIVPTLKVVTEEGRSLVEDASLQLPIELSEALFQAMWDEGFRPKGQVPTDLSISSLQNHIKFAESVVERLLS